MQLRIPQLTSNQHQTQQHKDLSIQHGDNITNKKSSHTRLAFQNAHGIDRQQPHLLPTEIIQQYKIDIFGIAETNCKWDDDIRYNLEARLQRTFGNAAISTAHTKTQTDTSFLPGGTLQITHGRMVGRRITIGQDTIGRFCWQAFHGNEGRKLLS